MSVPAAPLVRHAWPFLMPFDDLTHFLQAAGDTGELERIPFSIDPDQEISALTHQICREFRGCGPAILCERPEGSAIPVVTNLLGSRSRFLKALSASHYDEVIQRLRTALDPLPAPRDWKLGFRSSSMDRAKVMPRIVRRGNCQQVVKLGHEIDLQSFPALRCWEGESGRFITSGIVVTETEQGRSTGELMPVEILGPGTLQLHWNPKGTTFSSWKAHAADRRPLPLAIAVGGDPLLAYAASLPLPSWMDFWYFTGVLRNESINLVRARSIDLHVPADAEIVFEGELTPAPPTGTGRCAAVSGLLESRSGLPTVSITTLTHRSSPLWPARVHSFDVSEELICCELTEKLLLEWLRMSPGGIVDLHLPACGGHRDIIFFSTESTSPDEVRQQLHAVCALPLACEASLVVAVGPQTDLRNADAVWREVSLSRELCGEMAGVTNPISNHGDRRTPRLLIDATGSSGRIETDARCLPTMETLSRLARKFESPRWESVEHTVPEMDGH